MSRPINATINLNAIRHNYQLAKSLASHSRALAVVKADAYGHGAIKVARALQEAADGFAVASIEEALELREAGINNQILLLEGFFSPDELPLIAQNELSIVIHCKDQIGALSPYEQIAQFDVWLKIDIGMHRLGVPLAQAEDLIEQLSSLACVKNLTLMGHFACADELESSITDSQLDSFLQIAEGKQLPLSLSNSAAILGWPNTHKDWSRPGLMLYGASPFDTEHKEAALLQPAMTLSSEVIAVREISSGESVGYGASWTATRPSRIGTLAVGYADGYPRQMRSGAPILIDGERTQIVGRVSMDMICVDLTDLPNAGVGSRAELFGEKLLATELAPWADTIPYTLFTGITRRVNRIYLDT